MVMVNPLLLSNHMTDNVDLYIKYKLGIFSILSYQIHIRVIMYGEIVN